MKRITKTIACMLALLTAVSLLGGCGKEEPAKPGETKAQVQNTEPRWPSLDPAQLRNYELGGDWETEDAVFVFDGQDYFWYADTQDRVLEGNYVFDSKDLYLKDLEGKVYHGVLDPQGSLRVDGLQGAFVLSEDSLDMGLLGTWTYQAGDLVLDFAADGTYYWQHQEDTGDGEYFYDGSEVTLMGEDETTGYVDFENHLHLEGMMGWFYSEGGMSYIPLSDEDRELLEPEFSTEVMKRQPLDNAVAIIQEDTGFYARIRADWTVGQLDNSYDGDPGYRSITVMAACYIPYTTPAGLSGVALNLANYALYDRYTGITLPFVDMLMDEDGIHHFEFDSRDGRVDMGILKTDLNLGSTADCRDIMTIEFNIVLPEWYDGLCFAALPMPDDSGDLEGYVDRLRPPYRSGMLEMPDDFVRSSLTFDIG